MNATAQKIMNPVTSQGVELRQPPRSGESVKMVGLMFFAAYFITCVALYAVHLKFDIDAKYFSIQNAKKRQATLRVRLDKLEADVNRLQSFNRIENVLRQKNVALAAPNEVFYVDLSGESGQVAALPGN